MKDEVPDAWSPCPSGLPGAFSRPVTTEKSFLSDSSGINMGGVG
jgi:hypothetical protein